jgi:YVTN family beta-propeller protein
MTGSWRMALVLTLGLLACDESSGPSGGTGGLAVEILPSAAGIAALDSGYVRVSGPTTLSVKVTPGSTVTIPDLLPGTYNLTLEGYVQGGLAYFGQVAGVTVTVGHTTPATITSFPRLRLSFQVEPTSVRAGRSLNPFVSARIVDPAGTVITAATNSVTIALGANPSRASLTGTKTVAAVNGVATFGDLQVTESGSNYDLVVTSGALISDTSVAFDVTYDFALASSGGTPTVSRIQTPSNAVVATIPSGTTSRYVDFTPDASRLYVTNHVTPGIVQVFKTSDNTLLTTVAVGDGPQGIAITQDGQYAVVANSGANTASLISIATNTVTATPAVGAFPIQVAITPDGAQAYVTNFNGGSVSVLNSHTGAAINTITTGGTAFGVAMNPTKPLAYVSSGTAPTVFIINRSTMAVTGSVTIGTTPRGLAVTPDGAFVYAANNADGTVSVIETTNHTVVKTITVDPSPWSVAVSRGGAFVYVSQFTQAKVTIIATATNTVVGSITVAANPQGFAVPSR